MDVTQLWKKIVFWLGDHAPATAATLQPPDPPPNFAVLEKEFGVRLPAELREWWLCCGGTEGGVLADILPPFYTPYGARGAWQAWCTLRETWSEQWDRPICDYYAGSAASSYHPAWIPIAGDGFSDELVVDLRPGMWHGCVLEWEQETAQLHRPEWSGVSAMLTDVWHALSEGVPAGHSYPTITEDGRIDWQIR